MDFRMTLEENIGYAKRNIVDLIYKSARIDGIEITFPETNELFEGRFVKGLEVNDVVTINNLKHAWLFLFNTIHHPFDIEYIKQINQIVQAGLNLFPEKIRTTEVTINGTSWIPTIPNEDYEIRQIKALFEIVDPTERAISIMTYLMKARLFQAGNKRSSQIIANHIMIKNGRGIISVPVANNIEFLDKLTKFYETNDNKEINKFLFDKCIDGFNHI